MDLPTHFLSGLAAGFIFFGRPEFALLVALGALIPDLDREYWFIPQQKYADEQRHRALFHNVVMLGLTYAISPPLSLGLFIHMIEDSFTTVRDRGVEWFYPFTRLAMRGRYDVNGDLQPRNPKEHVYYYQEDPKGLLALAEPDLRVHGPNPVPWRRVYGFALNSNLLDRGLMFGSILVIMIWLFVPSVDGTWPNLATVLNTPLRVYEEWLVGFAAISVLFLAGELDRNDATIRSTRLGLLKVLAFLIGLALLVYWIWLNRTIFANGVHSISTQPLTLIASLVMIPLLAIAIILWMTKGLTEDTTI